MKQATFVVEAPERVRFSYEIAESATRAAAFLIDTLIQGLLVFLLLLSVVGSFAVFGRAVGVFAAFAFVVFFAVQWCYGVFFELVLAGRTPGKLLFHLRVVRLDGEALDGLSIILRNLLRAADGIPLMFFPLLGGFVSIADPWSRRIGDLVAGTVVVRDLRASLVLPEVGWMPTFRPLQGPTTVTALARRLDERELAVLRRFLARYYSMPSERAARVAEELSAKVAARLGIERKGEAKGFLEEVWILHAPSRSALFGAARSADWKELARLLEKVRRTGPGSLGEAAGRFAALYREASGDLAEARATALAPDLEEYLNSIVGEARAVIYSPRPIAASAVAEFFLRSVPGAFRRSLPFVGLSALLFAGSFGLSLALSLGDGGRGAKEIASPAFLEAMLESHSANRFDGRDAEEGSFAVSYYIANNVGIDFLTMATGVFFGLGSLFFLVENGLSLGAVTGYLVANDAGPNLGRFVLAHSAFELSGLLLSGAAGFLLGWTVLRSGKESRARALRRRMGDFLPLIGAAGLLTFLAAFVEGFVSPSAASIQVRAAIALLSLTGIAIWLSGSKKAT